MGINRIALPSQRIDYVRLFRNAQATGAATASSGQGAMKYSEGWNVAIDATNVWTTSVGATGTVAMGTNAGRQIALLNCPAASDRAEMQGKKVLTNPGVSSPTLDIYQQLVMEWEMLLGTLANIENTLALFGLINAGGARTSNNIIGFILASDALNVITDAAAAETVTVFPSPPTLTVSNKYKIVVRNGAVDFYVNDVLGVTHTANIPALPFQPQFRVDAEAATGATKAEIGAVRCYYLD